MATNQVHRTRVLAAPLLAAAALLPPAAAHTPFGYQSDSTHSWEFRNGDATSDPSSYAGAVHYDPLHHALYLTGSTFASSVFDGVDVYGLTTAEKDELLDQDPTNDGFWWDNMMTGLRPHLHMLGVPGYSPAKGDCFYAILGLPNDAVDPSGDPEQSRVKLVHSRRFGSEGVQESCSAMDVLFTSPAAAMTGGYAHTFEPGMEKDVPIVGGSVNDGNPGASSLVKPPTRAVTLPPGQTHAPHAAEDFMTLHMPTYPPTATQFPTTATDAPTRSHEPSPEGGWPTLSPTEDLDFLDFAGGPGGRDLAEGGKAQTDLEGRDGNASEPNEQQPRQLLTPSVPLQGTRSVRLLMAGHVESPEKSDGYVVGDLPPGQFDQASVYGFAQQVDVRLPAGDLEKPEVTLDIEELGEEKYDQLDYHLHEAAKEEEELASELDPDWKVNLPQDDFAKIVSSGVESRALLNDHVPENAESIYPVALVADPTSKKHYYIAALASSNANFNGATQNNGNVDSTVGQGASQRAWTEYGIQPNINLKFEINNDADEFGGKRGRPRYGSDYRVIVKKMTIDAVDETELDDAEKQLAAKSYDSEKLIAMRHEWMQPFEPDLGDDVRPAGLLFAPSGDAHGMDDMLIMVGTTAGRGSAFGTMSEKGSASTQDQPKRQDLDGFVTKIRTDTGAFAGRNKFDLNTNSFQNMHSMRIKSNPGQNEMVAGVCAKPLRAVGMQTKMTHVYVVGSTSALLPGIPSDVRSSEFLATHPPKEPEQSMEAFLMKVDLATMDVVWTVQVGAISEGEGYKGNAYGYGCAVTRDGQDVYLTGLVKSGSATDFSDEEFNGKEFLGLGGTDVFLTSYKTSNGSKNFLKQVGSDRDDFPSRGNGGITTDRFGNAILTGNTKGSLMRERANYEYKYGSVEAAASDVFVMSFDRVTGRHVPLLSDGMPGPLPPKPDTPPPTPPAPPQTPIASEQVIETKNAALVGVVAIALAFILIAAAASIFVVFRIRKRKSKEQEVLFQSGDNLHDSHSGGRNLQSRRRSTWGMRKAQKELQGSDFNDLNIMVEVRNSASGGWHGVYDDEQLQAIDFGIPSGNADADNVVEQSLFMDDGLKEIEESMGNYEIGEMDDVSDEDLIKAYNDAMALDIEPENPDVEFAMQGLGSDLLDDDGAHRQIT